MSHTALNNHIQKFASPTEADLIALFKIAEEKEVEAKAHLLQEGHLCHHVYFVIEGSFRIYFRNKKGTEKNINFAIEDWWITDFDSVLNGEVSHLNIQAIEPAKVLKISQHQLDELLETSLALNQYFRKLHERVRISNQRRIEYMFNLSGKEIYESFCEKNPGFVQRIPLYMLASYIGITPEFLSKIRAEKE